jgi:energy-coupling factor transporter ATP-binding protein EcfA2
MEALEALQPSAAETPFASVAELRAEHNALLRATRGRATGPGLVERINGFLGRARATGRLVYDPDERDGAQGILDYWTATLVTLVDPRDVVTSPALLAAFDPSYAPDLAGAAAPFMGLRAFEEMDAVRFHGREEEIRALAARVQAKPVVVVTGPSGSGKSSLIRAGLLPLLGNAAREEGTRWHALPVVIPGSDPLAALLVAVCPAGTDPQRWVGQERPKLEKSAAHFRQLAEAAAPAPALLVVDQMEELVTLCDDPAVREHFAQAVSAFVAAPLANRLVLAVREDFTSAVMDLKAFRPVAADPDAQYHPRAMSPRELRSVIESPAREVGLNYEAGIIDELVREVMGEPSALPLLQFTLSQLWDKREGNLISWRAYRQVGRPREALKRTADAVFDEMKIIENEMLLERIFVELVQPSVGAEYVRRRVRREVLARLGAPSQINEILERCVGAGLLRVTPGVERNDDRFEVVHEALIRNWPRLAEWLRKKRTVSQREIQFVNAARLWIQSGRDRGYLLNRVAVKEARQYAVGVPELGELISASERSSQRWLYAVVALLMVALGTAVYGWWSSAEAREAMAEEQALSNRRLRIISAQWDSIRRVLQEADVRVNTATAALDNVVQQSENTLDPAAVRRAENARFGVRLYALNADPARFRTAADALRARGFALARESNTTTPWSKLAQRNTIFYYNPEAQAKTAEIAEAMQEATGEPFEVKRGASDGQTRRDVLIVHWVPRTGA